MSKKLAVAGITLEIKESDKGAGGPPLFEVHGFCVDEDRPHWVFGHNGLREIGKWLIAFVGTEAPATNSGDKADPRTWEVIVTGPAS